MAMGRTRWRIVLPILFLPVAVNYGVSSLLRVSGLSDSLYLDVYPWTLLGIYALLAFIVRQASSYDGPGLSAIFNFESNKLRADLEVGVLLFFALYLVNSVYATLWSVYLPVPSSPIGTNPLTIGIALLALPIAAGLVEELVWRGYGITRLMTLTGSGWVSIVVASIGFGIWHIDLYGFGYAFLDGILLGYVYTRYRRMLPLVVGHWVLDFYVTFVYLL